MMMGHIALATSQDTAGRRQSQGVQVNHYLAAVCVIVENSSGHWELIRCRYWHSQETTERSCAHTEQITSTSAASRERSQRQGATSWSRA